MERDPVYWVCRSEKHSDLYVTARIGNQCCYCWAARTHESELVLDAEFRARTTPVEQLAVLAGVPDV